MKRTLIVALTLAASAPAFAQDTGETAREVVGWTPDGKVVVRAVSQGERIVKGTSKSYYYELDEVWDTRLGMPTASHQRGEVTGFEHPGWKKAEPKELAYNSWEPGQTSPDGKHLVVNVIREDRSPGNDGWVCTATVRTVLMSKEANAVFNAAESKFQGEPASRESAAKCPRITSEVGWSKDARTFAVERRADDEFSVVSGSTNATGNWAESPMRASSSIDPLGSLAVGPLRTTWEALLLSDQESAKAGIASQTEDTGWSLVAKAWIAARDGDEKEAKKFARSAEKSVKGDPIGLAMLGGAYALIGDNRRTKRTMNKALKAGIDWKQYIQMARIVEDVDLSLYNQILVYGLSSEDGKANAEAWAWRLLIDGLVDAGIASKGKDLIERIAQDSPARAGAEARLAVGEGNGAAARDKAGEMLWANVGTCDGYLLAGRAELLTGAPAAAVPLLKAAAFCDPNEGEGPYFLAELHRAAGRASEALDASKLYLQAAPARRNDAVRDLRRDRAQKTIERLGTPGLGLVSLSCRRLGPAFLCQGVVYNSSSEPVTGGVAVVRTKSAELAKTDLPEVPPRETRSFGIRVETLEDATLVAGRDEAEQKRNEVINLNRGW